VSLKWYIVHVYSGYENKVKAALEERIATSSAEDMFGEVMGTPND
jgi:transcriptional antiterminator NusG